MDLPGLKAGVGSKTELMKLAAKVFGVNPRTVWRRFQAIENEET